MRLCYLSNPNSIHTQRWVRYFAEQGNEVHLISTLETPSYNLEGVQLYQLTSPIRVKKVRVLGLAYRLRELLSKIQPDILHAHQISTYGWLGALSGYHPFIITVWGSDLLRKPQQSLIYRFLTGYALRKADYVTCVSENLAQKARAFRISEHKLEVAPWGVDTSIFHPVSDEKQAQLREKLGFSSDPLVLSLRPVRPVYNPLTVAKAIPLILQQVPQAKFIIRTYAYDRPLFDRFQAIVRQNEAEKAIRYVGNLPHDEAIAELYQVADVALSVPFSDGTPLSVLEALACGNALVLSDLPSLHEWVREKKEALFVSTEDVQSLADAVIRLLLDEPLRRRLKENALGMIQKRADSQVWMNRAANIYEELLVKDTLR